MITHRRELLDRIRIIMNHYGYDIERMASATTIHLETLASVLKEEIPYNDAMLNKICGNLNIRKIWLMTGVGEMISPVNPRNEWELLTPEEDQALRDGLKKGIFKFVPFVPPHSDIPDSL